LIVIDKENISELQKIEESKKKAGEDIYNSLRDQISLQEDKIKQLREKILKIRESHVQVMQTEGLDWKDDI
jgi:hypothetical protein